MSTRTRDPHSADETGGPDAGRPDGSATTTPADSSSSNGADTDVEPIRRGDVCHAYRGSSPVHGDGVFASVDLAAGDVIEVCPVLVVAAEDVEAFNTTGLDHHCYAWAHDQVAVALGLGSLYNHSFTPNAEFETDHEAGTVTISALVAIARDEEITFNYLGDSTDPAGLWFDLDD